MPIDDNQSAISVASEGSPCVDHPSIGPSHDSFDIHQHHLVAHHPPPGASVYPPSAPFSGALNPRSCVTCRRRKVCRSSASHAPCRLLLSVGPSACRGPADTFSGSVRQTYAMLQLPESTDSMHLPGPWSGAATTKTKRPECAVETAFERAGAGTDEAPAKTRRHCRRT